MLCMGPQEAFCKNAATGFPFCSHLGSQSPNSTHHDDNHSCDAYDKRETQRNSSSSSGLSICPDLEVGYKYPEMLSISIPAAYSMLSAAIAANVAAAKSMAVRAHVSTGCSFFCLHASPVPPSSSCLGAHPNLHHATAAHETRHVRCFPHAPPGQQQARHADRQWAAGTQLFRPAQDRQPSQQHRRLRRHARHPPPPPPQQPSPCSSRDAPVQPAQPGSIWGPRCSPCLSSLLLCSAPSNWFWFRG